MAIPAPALEISKYDELSIEENTRYLRLLLTGTEKLNVVRGMRQFSEDLTIARQLQQKTGRVFQVEHALLLTYKKLGLGVAQAGVMALGKGFTPSR